ncbi:outer membrane lipoprotein carrier protein LolA [Terrimonas sp.]|uniref:LolA family protein n=1 Tax=Terrimonas sp. TaxID=1914338 RepID=UPI000D51F189|nr:outer membrane lipoprotein carrier protein LolA [Terrimonas sp.]PVD49782.1 outer membrane lipoprotein carrier protein LolA [Terrimonas sp.]
MRSIFLLGYILMSSLVANAQYSGYKPVADAAAFKVQFAEASKKTNAIKSDFVQEKNLSLLAEKITSKGKFWFKKDNLVRMEYTQPFQYLMILNGTNVYVKDSQKENKVSVKSNKLFQQINKIMVDCVKGEALQSGDFTVKVFENSSTYLAELIPVDKNMKKLFKNINMIIEKKSFGVTAIEMHEPSGDNTVINFVNRELNTNLPDALFTIH